MIGQDRVRRLLIDWAEGGTLPRFVILYGPRGCGKKLLVEHLASHRKQIVTVSDDLKVDALREIMQDARALKSETFILLPDADQMHQSAANALLKFLEEPPKNAYIFMTVESLDNVLSTIKSRAWAIEMEPYTKTDLALIADNWASETGNPALPWAATVFDTPGQVIRAHDLMGATTALYELTQKLVFHIGRASAANVFKVAQNVDAENVDLFLSLVLYWLGERFKQTVGGAEPEEVPRIVRMSKVVSEYKGLFRNRSLNKEHLLEMFLVALRGAAL